MSGSCYTAGGRGPAAARSSGSSERTTTPGGYVTGSSHGKPHSNPWCTRFGGGGGARLRVTGPWGRELGPSVHRRAKGREEA